jgi:hypothetical protein
VDITKPQEIATGSRNIDGSVCLIMALAGALGFPPNKAGAFVLWLIFREGIGFKKQPECCHVK